jgi:hypothetical protein
VVHPPNDLALDVMLCDSAVTAEGKLYVQGGGWNMLGSPVFPFQVPRIGLAVVASVPYSLTNMEHSFELRLEAEDGQQVSIGPLPSDPSDPPVRIGAQFSVGRPPIVVPGDPQAMPFAINVDGQVFTAPGGYAFVISIDGAEVHRLQFRIHSVAESAHE